MTLVVVLTDANVIFSRVIRDYLMYAAEAGIVELRWSSKVLEEMTRNHTIRRGITPERGAALVALMNKAIPNALVDPDASDFAVFENIPMPDPDDRHVLAAAIAADADVLCTLNVKDFPAAAMSAAGVLLQKPDEVLTRLALDFPLEMAKAHARAVDNLRGATDESTLGALRRAQCPNASDSIAAILTAMSADIGSDDPSASGDKSPETPAIPVSMFGRNGQSGVAVTVPSGRCGKPRTNGKGFCMRQVGEHGCPYHG